MRCNTFTPPGARVTGVRSWRQASCYVQLLSDATFALRLGHITIRVIRSRPVCYCVASVFAALAFVNTLGTAVTRADDGVLTITGAGFGHGVGMSQWGALGFAKHGAKYNSILAHYYPGTRLGIIDPHRPVRVLLQVLNGPAAFRGANAAGGIALDPNHTYYVGRKSATTVNLLDTKNHKLISMQAPLRVTGSQPIHLLGRTINGVRDGAFRGVLDFYPEPNYGVNAVNTLGLDDYIAGVIDREMPSSWPLEAVKAQAVASRSLVVNEFHRGKTFDVFPDTRSQVYGGVGAETKGAWAATNATRGQLVTYRGKPVVVYFYDTSGGRTEDVRTSELGGTRFNPWLVSVDDPYDSISPVHHWGPITMTLAQATARLGGLVKGRLLAINVTKRGYSPRIQRATIVGTKGDTVVSGGTLRYRFNLRDTWAYFTIVTKKPQSPKAQAVPGKQLTPTKEPKSRTSKNASVTGKAHSSGTSVGGTQAPTHIQRPRGQRSRLVKRRVIAGRVQTRRPTNIVVQQLIRRRWRTVTSRKTSNNGSYRFALRGPGVFRVVFGHHADPAIRVR